jgi:NADH oxidase (H2O2-forming)
LKEDYQIVVIGCGAGGGTAAQFAKKTNRKSRITIIEKGQYPQYSKCGIPYTISGIIPKIDDLIEFSEEWFSKQNIELILNANAEQIDIKNKKIFVKKYSEIFEKSFDSLIIATGADPVLPPIKNLKKGNNCIEGVFSVRTLDDAKKISSYIKNKYRVIIVGAGLIGLEMADSLFKRGLKVTIVEVLSDILLNTLDKDMARIVSEKISDEIIIFKNHHVTKVESVNGKLNKVCIKNKITDLEKSIDCDMLIIVTGTKPNIDLAKRIGCKIGLNGGIVISNKSETNISNVYAVGDCTEYSNYVNHKHILTGLGSIVVRQGIAAGINAAGGDYKLLQGVLNTSTSEFFNIQIASVGPTSDNLKDFSVISAKYNGLSLPEYFPNKKRVSVKLLVDEITGNILGAQIVGDNAAFRINTFAAAILGGIHFETFRKLETAYAPPIAPPFDVITLVCDKISIKLSHKK